MTHYVCRGGCKGVSEDFGFCQAPDCPHNGEILEECECEDEKHGFENNVESKDVNGVILQNGDSVQLTKDLDVKGSAINLKRGKVIKKIKLIGDPDNVEFREGKTTMVIKTCYVKKV